MNRRRFLELLGMASVGAIVAYSFPEIIIPKNIISPTEFLTLKFSDHPDFGFGFTGFTTTEKDPYFGESQFRFSKEMIFQHKEIPPFSKELILIET